MLRIKRIFDLDRSFRNRPPDEIKPLREEHLRPHIDAFFDWVAEHYAEALDRRGLLRTALGYAHRQRGPLTRFFDDGRLRLTNNQFERELRRIVLWRKSSFGTTPKPVVASSSACAFSPWLPLSAFSTKTSSTTSPTLVALLWTTNPRLPSFSRPCIPCTCPRPLERGVNAYPK